MSTFSSYYKVICKYWKSGKIRLFYLGKAAKTIYFAIEKWQNKDIKSGDVYREEK